MLPEYVMEEEGHRPWLLKIFKILSEPYIFNVCRVLKFIYEGNFKLSDKLSELIN